METQQEIESIIASEYNHYRGSMMKAMEHNHSVIRKTLGDEQFLIYLKQQLVQNPRPVFEIDLSKYTISHGKE